MARSRHLIAAAWIAVGALLLRLILPSGFPNYDTLYSLVWGAQLGRGQTPSYDLALAPTPHPLAELLGLVTSPLGAAATIAIVLALAYLALAALPYLVFELGREWFSWPVGVAAAAILITRYEVLSYGVRAYVDIPYTALVLTALLVETRRRRAGWPVIALLDIAGLLRPEAWLFAATYWVYLAVARTDRRTLAWLALLGVAPAVAWVASDGLVTGNLLWSLRHTQSTATTLRRPTGLLKFPYTGARRLGEVLGPDGLIAGGVGLVLSLWLARGRAMLLGVGAGVVALVAFAAIASSGLPIDDRYTFVIVALGAVFAGAGLFGWLTQPGRIWRAGAIVCAIAIVAFVPWNVTRLRETFNSTNPKKQSLSAQLRVENDLIALTRDHAIALRCGKIGVPYHTPIPLLALELHTSPANIVPREIARGTFVAAASPAVREIYLLDLNDPAKNYAVPPGFRLSAENRSWRVYTRCGP
ncbi:MAG: hypothetical protein ABSC56_04005 [Solirubrobacteraceae bacterium]